MVWDAGSLPAQLMLHSIWAFAEIIQDGQECGLYHEQYQHSATSNGKNASSQQNREVVYQNRI